jgi:hypothetical protein
MSAEITPHESKMKNELNNITMTKTCARDLTDRINSSSEDLAGMLKRAHDENAWQALGYDSWPKYVAGEIKLCKSRVFQLLDHETIRRELKESTIVDGAPLISNELLPSKEAVTRELKKVDPAKRPEVYAKAVESAGGEQPTAKQVEAAVVESIAPEPISPEEPAQEKAPSDGMLLAKKAIECLSRIEPNDTERTRAFRHVAHWMSIQA